MRTEVRTPLQMPPLPPPTHLPVMGHKETESLSLCVCTQVSLKTKRINGRNEGFDYCVEGGLGWVRPGSHDLVVVPTQCTHNYANTIGWSLHPHKIVGLHQARSAYSVCVCVVRALGGCLYPMEFMHAI